ncbi:MAG TPA: GMC oxidoreductase [Steroidobacteraceae bacterium]|nr:GMC oxidoreductase [Steroidobacteraceae bacterium]
MTETQGAADEWDYIIVGSGPGGGTLAARLAEAGMRVFLLEAGGDPGLEAGERLPDDYRVPGFHAFACENPAMSWDFEVRHYANEARQARDFKYDAARGGVFYPRAAALGGCSAHNAMIFMLPHDSDWDHIRELTGDPSWSARRMRRHARALENCGYRPLWRVLALIGINPTGHGFRGWLHTERPLEFGALGDPAMVLTLFESALEFARRLPHRWRTFSQWLRRKGDPNARSWRSRSFEGLCYTPLSTKGNERTGARERVLDVSKKYPETFHIELDALATRVLFDASGGASGIEYLKGRHLYRAHAAPSGVPGELRQVFARREVILCGGAFNTPQLLMLSGIGPAAHLREHGIAVRTDLPGVGRNLQDRYEVAVTYRAQQPWRILDGARFERGDPLWQLWNTARNGRRKGLYASNGAALAFVRYSDPALPEPDVFSMALPTRFEGYFHHFSQWLQRDHDVLTWAVLKAHTVNRAGTVELRSADPRDPPRINFHYFDEGDDKAGKDLAALVDAVAFIRGLAQPLLAGGVFIEECAPGKACDTKELVADYIRDTAWGHHASCSCPVGPAAAGGVLDSAFKVHGTPRLRVVDASVFPRIPGFFVVSAVYMIAEKAAETILGNGPRARARNSSQ